MPWIVLWLVGSGDESTTQKCNFVCTVGFHYCAGDKIEKNEMGGACSAVGEGRGVYRVLVGKPVGKRPLGRPRRRWEYNIKMDLQELGYGERPPIWRVAVNILNKQSLTVDKVWSSSLGVGRGANNSSPWKCIFVTKCSQTKPRTWAGAGCEWGNEPSGSIKCGNFLTSCKPVSFSRRTLQME
jgi:hypothetical protein